MAVVRSVSSPESPALARLHWRTPFWPRRAPAPTSGWPTASALNPTVVGKCISPCLSHPKSFGRAIAHQQGPQNLRLVGSRPRSTRPYCSDAVSQESDTWWDAAWTSRWNRCKGLASKRACPPLPSNRRFTARRHSVATYAWLRRARRRSSSVGIALHCRSARGGAGAGGIRDGIEGTTSLTSLGRTTTLVGY